MHVSLQLGRSRAVCSWIMLLFLAAWILTTTTNSAVGQAGKKKAGDAGKKAAAPPANGGGGGGGEKLRAAIPAKRQSLQRSCLNGSGDRLDWVTFSFF